MADIVGTSGDDTLPGTSGADTISGLEGDDTLQGLEGNDELLGGDGNDFLDGGDGDDILRGGAGNNTFQGWAGNDTFYVAGDDSVSGGDGNDTLNVGSVLGTIYDGGAGTDDSLTLDFSAAGAAATVDLRFMFTGSTGSIGTASVDSFERISGTIFGSGFNDQITIGQFYSGAVTMALGAGNDTAVGGSGNDTIDGGAGDDNVSGGEGNDVLSDSAGANNLYGEGGDDLITLGAATAGNIDGGAGGADRLAFDLASAAAGVSISLNVVAGSITGSIGNVSVANFETMALVFQQTTEHNDTITLGAAFNQAMTINLLGGNDTYVGGLGGDYVNGGAGNDTLGGGGGTNTLIGGIGNDSYVVENDTTTLVEAAGQGTDIVLASLSFALFNVSNIENLTLTGLGNINGYGDGAANVITGNNGANRIEAYGGNDTVNGGGGNDTLYGMEGNDTVNGEGGNDTIEDGVGTNTLNGGGGDDYIVFSGDAVNTADGGIGSDSLSISNFNRTSGFAIDLTGMWSGGTGSVNGGTVTGFESLIGFEGTQWADVINFGAGTTANAGINDAGAGDDVLTGTDGDNYINGGGGNDTIVSGAGTDTLLGGAGDDSITVGITTAGTVDGGAGTDTLGFVQYAFGPAVALDIDFTLLWGGGTGAFNGIAVTGIELLETDFIVGAAPFFASGDDSVVIGAGYTGNVNMELGTGADSARGGSGNDAIDGAQDDDVLRGGAGNDTLGGSYGSDYAYGEAGDDILGGDTLDGEWAWGNDHLYGGGGNDTIEGGAYGDWLYGGTGNDVLRGDSLALSEPDHGADLLSGGTGHDQLFGHGGDDTLAGDDGDDTVTGGLGADAMDGGAGIDAVNYSTSAAGVSVSLPSGTGTGGDAQGDSFVGFENVVGSAFSDVLTGDSAANSLFGGDGIDRLIGGNGQDILAGGGGTDRLYGNAGIDTLGGGTGGDRLFGGFGKDTLTGNAGNDQFAFLGGETAATRAAADVITDFNQAHDDLIRLKEMDANTTLSGDQRFTFIGLTAFTGVARQLHYVHDGGNTYIEGDTDGDGNADFVIRLDGLIDLTKSDFLL